MRFIAVLILALAVTSCKIEPCSECLVAGEVVDRYSGEKVQGMELTVQEVDTYMGQPGFGVDIEATLSDADGHYNLPYSRKRKKEGYRLVPLYLFAYQSGNIVIGGDPVVPVLPEEGDPDNLSLFPFEFQQEGIKLPNGYVDLNVSNQEADLTLVRYGGVTVENLDPNCGTTYDYVRFSFSNAYGESGNTALSCVQESTWLHLPAGDWVVQWTTIADNLPVDSDTIQFHIAPDELTFVGIQP